jgi:putative FmdB family regulatory protein
MPLFEYRCSTCGHLEEVLQKHGEPPPDPCPACGKSATMAKEVSLTSFQLKGGGWYKDLYASTPKEGGKKEGGKEGGSASESGSSSSTTSAAPASSAPATPSTSTSAAPAKSSTPATSG